MSDKILESLFLDQQLWIDAVEHGVDKDIPVGVMEDFADPHYRAELCRRIAYGEYQLEPPHTAYIPKDDGRERTIFVNTPTDRVLLHVIYKWLMRSMPEMIHPTCRSYQEGIGVGMIVRDFSRQVCHYAGEDSNIVVGRKFDIHKYFDTVSRSSIMQAFNAVEELWGKSSVIDLLREYFNSDIYYDTREKRLVESYQGLKQGCAVSSWLANVILYSLDKAVAEHKGLYVRYSDDIVYVGDDYQEVSDMIVEHLATVGLTLNEKKIESISTGQFVRFLGYNIRGGEITLSEKWVRSFRREIDSRTIRNKTLINKVRNIRKRGADEMESQLSQVLQSAARDVVRYLYYGNGEFSWAGHVFGIVNRDEDLMQMNLYCIDALKAVYTGKTDIGGLGVSKTCGIMRGKGRNVTSNRIATAHLGWIEGYVSMMAMQRLMSNKWVYRAVTQDLVDNHKPGLYHSPSSAVYTGSVDSVYSAEVKAELERRYDDFKHSQPDGKTCCRFYALPLDQMNTIDLLRGHNRSEARERLESWIADSVNYCTLTDASHHWYWQSSEHPELVLLRKWFD